jgi:hypothetical protein
VRCRAGGLFEAPPRRCVCSPTTATWSPRAPDAYIAYPRTTPVARWTPVGRLHSLRKAMVLTLQDCDAMLPAARGARRVLMVAHCIAFGRNTSTPSLYEGGPAGRAPALNWGRQGRRTSGGATPAGWAAWNEGGAIYDLHIHDVDFHIRSWAATACLRQVPVPGEGGGYDHVLANCL